MIRLTETLSVPPQHEAEEIFLLIAGMPLLAVLWIGSPRSRPECVND